MDNINKTYDEFSKAQLKMINILNSQVKLLDDEGKRIVRAKIREQIEANKGFEALFNKINI